MLIHPLPCVTAFVDRVNESLEAMRPGSRLTAIQRAWLGVVLMGIVVTEKLCWAAFERRSLGVTTESQLRWMFRYAKVAWSYLLQASVRSVLLTYGVQGGTLIIDDTDKRRAKVTKKIAGAHKVKDKKSGGYFNGQEIVFLLLATETVTVPVDFRFYVPDPEVSAWRRRREEQKRQGVPAKEREPRPAQNANYPTKPTLAVDMLKAFVGAFPQIRIHGVVADALYGHARFMDDATQATQGAQVVSELRANQLVISRGKAVSLKDYFARQAGVAASLRIRGQQDRAVVMLAARLAVKSHQKKRFVVALRYAGESEYRFLAAADLSWRHEDIARMYSLRWLVEVFIEDWKGHGGFSRLTKQQGDTGSTRGVILSLLCDHLLLLHPDQSARLKNKQPASTVGCLIERLQVDALIGAVQQIVHAADPLTALDAFAQALRDALPERLSRKHMAGRALGRQEPTPSLLRYRAVA